MRNGRSVAVSDDLDPIRSESQRMPNADYGRVASYVDIAPRYP
jgi:hypothetical protein